MVVSSLLFVIIWSILQVGQTQQYSCTGFVTPSTSPYVSFFKQSLTNVPWSDCDAVCKAFHPNAYLMRPNDSYQLAYVHNQWGLANPWVNLFKNNASQWVWGDGSGRQTARFSPGTYDSTVGFCGIMPDGLGDCGTAFWCGDASRAGLGDLKCSSYNSCACQLMNCKYFNLIYAPFNCFIVSSCTLSTCPAGAYISNSTCTACPPARYSGVKFSPSCNDCPIGKYGNWSGISTCLDCSAGRFSSIPASKKCQLCPTAKYQSNTGKTTCIDCPNNTYHSYVGATSSSYCSTCPIGTAQLNASEPCVPCPQEGFYSSGPSCIACPPGTYGFGAISACSDCAAATYSDINSSTSCQDCPVGKWSNNTRSNSSQACIPCAAGKYSPFALSQQEELCFSCPENYWSSTQGASSVSTCQSCANVSLVYLCTLTNSIDRGINMPSWSNNSSDFCWVLQKFQHRCGYHLCVHSSRSLFGSWCWQHNMRSWIRWNCLLELCRNLLSTWNFMQKMSSDWSEVVDHNCFQFAVVRSCLEIARSYFACSNFSSNCYVMVSDVLLIFLAVKKMATSYPDFVQLLQIYES
jgi:hypothetical protein